ncbi:MAG: bifunctional glutamate N-acetyltransferase/amino-acid acetyltransferase ArgJ [Dehalococcoidia bacterium]
MAKARPGGAVRLIDGGSVTSPQGFVAGGVYAGIKAAGKGKLDLGILASERPAACAAMFTRSTVKGFGVLVSAMHARRGAARAVIVNSGCSNVATGRQGMLDALEMAELAAARLGIAGAEVLVGSTGVIGRPLPMPLIRDGAPRIKLGADGGAAFARAIITTDTYAKTLAVRFRAGGREYRIGAAAKGSGMIHPDMATMFCFLTTDAPVELAFLRRTLREAVGDSLNMISVDNDTSTSDTVAIFANGAAGGAAIYAGSPGAAAFASALPDVCVRVAKLLARDGEGAKKLIEARVEGAGSAGEARAAARTITASPLVKTAVHGNDPNWGRLLMAVGRSGAGIDLERARAWIGPTMVYRGEPVRFDERAVSRYLRGEEVVLRVDLGRGFDSATAWGCDMTPEYVHINADYRT